MLLRLVVQAEHEVQDGLASQDLVADVGAQHDVVLVLEDGCGEAGPDHQPACRAEAQVTALPGPFLTGSKVQQFSWSEFCYF